MPIYRPRWIQHHDIPGQANAGIRAIAVTGSEVATTYNVGSADCTPEEIVTLDFQKEPKGRGLTNEILLAIVIDRLEAFQQEVPCWQNKHALHDIRNALTYLKDRTTDRVKREVEGTKAP